MKEKMDFLSPNSPPLIFPNHLGPGTRDVTSALLYHGHLVTSLPGWLHSGPIQSFLDVGKYAARTNHSLSPLFNVVLHYFDLAQTHVENERKFIEPIQDRFTKSLTVYPGTFSAYDSWRPFHQQCLYDCHAKLSDPITMATASVEFIWRTWECALEFGADPESPESVDPAKILEYYKKRSEEFRNPEFLLAECVLNRYCMPRTGSGNYVTDSMDVARTISIVCGNSTNEESVSIDDKVESLSFHFFHEVIRQYTKPLSRDYVPVVARLFDERAAELDSMINKCRSAALELCADPPDERFIRRVLLEKLQVMSDEAAAIANTDEKSVNDFFRTLAEDKVVWGAVAGFIGSSAVLPQAAVFSFGIGAMAAMGANAVKAKNTRDSQVASSPWSFIYYANRLV